MTDSCEARWKPTQNQIDDLILPAYTEMAKKSVEYIAKFQCPPGYVADMLRDIADAIEYSHPESESDFHAVKFCAELVISCISSIQKLIMIRLFLKFFFEITCIY